MTFDLQKYFTSIDILIKKTLSKPTKNIITYDILDTEFTKKYKLFALKEKQRQMKIGKIWQIVLGNYKDCIDLHCGHETGLDIISYKRKFCIELKNRTNTDNFSSKKTNFDKLAKFKQEHSDFMCIYANINEDTEEKTLIGTSKIIIHNGVEIHILTGHRFLDFILDDNKYVIINFIKKIIQSQIIQ